MHRSYAANARFVSAAVIVFVGLALAMSSPAMANTLYANGFEANTTDWTDVSRVSSGTGGITSASGNFHGTLQSQTGAFSRWGGYNYGAGNAMPTTFQEYTTSIDVYLDVAGGWANNTRFDFSSAINNAAGVHFSDFVFNGGFYNDATGPGANTNRFVISASANSQPGSAFAKNPGRDPTAISTTGWYTLQHHFYEDGGFLNVDMNIFDSSAALVHAWTFEPGSLTQALAAPIASIGGNRYGWFDYNEFGALAIDNASLTTASSEAAVVPLPMAAWAGVSLIAGLGGFRGIKRWRTR